MYLAYAAKKNQPNPDVGDAAESYVYSEGTDLGLLNHGFSIIYSGQFLSKGFGFIDESDLPYDRSEKEYLDIDLTGLEKKRTALLENAYTSYYDPDLMKEAIMEFGAVGIGYYDDTDPNGDSRSGEAGESYFYDGDQGINHSVTVIGWDDSYDRNNFSSSIGTKPSSNGAWLVRNSWGDDDDPLFGMDKYFWLSYESKGLEAFMYFFDVADSPGDYDHYYYYDTQVHSWDMYEEKGKTYHAANVFTMNVDSDQLLQSLVFELYDLGIPYSVMVYTDLRDPDDPESGRLAAVESGYMLCAGTFTVPVSTPVRLEKGSTFSVILKTEDISAAIEMEDDPYFEYTAGIKVRCGIRKGQSFFLKEDGWKDMTDVYAEEPDLEHRGNFCICAKTKDLPPESNASEDNDNDIIYEEYKDTAGESVRLIHDTESDCYRTDSGQDVLVLSKEDGSSAGIPSYQYTSGRIIPGKESFLVFKGVLYRYKTDYRISFKKNKNAGIATATVKWAKGSAPYAEGIRKSRMSFNVAKRTVSDNMVNAMIKHDKIKSLTVTADGITMKAKKKDYSYTSSGDVFHIDFKNNFTGRATVKNPVPVQ